MKALLISPQTPEMMARIQQFLEDLGVESTSLTEEALEDAGLGVLMREVDRSDRVSADEVLDKLRS